MRSAAWFLILFGIGYLGPGLWMFSWHSTIRETWPAVTSISEGVRVISRHHNKQLVYSIEYDLRYRVDSRDYVTPFAPQRSTSSRTRAQETAAAFAQGTRHTIWYDPANPHSIRNDVGSVRLFLLPALFTGIGALMLGIGIFLYRRPVRRKRPEPPPVRDRRASLIAGGVFTGLGLIMLAGNAWWVYRQFTVLAGWTETTGTVVDRQFQRRNINGSLRFESRIRFDYQAGTETFRNVAEPDSSSNYGWIRQRYDHYEPGSSHPIRYHPADPTRIRIDAKLDVQQLLPVGLIGVLGLIFLPLGYVVLSPALKARSS